MIVVIGPRELSLAVTAQVSDQLVVGAADDRRLSGPPAEAAAAAAALPLMARVCVISAESSPVEYCAAVRSARGSLVGSRIVVLGDPPRGVPSGAWERFVDQLGALPIREVRKLHTLIELDDLVRVATPTVRRSADADPGWRDHLRARSRRQRRRHIGTGPAPALAERQLDELIRQPFTEGCLSIAVVSPKGGVGKTLLSFLLGSTLAHVRGGLVVAVDTNPDFGTLADLAPRRSPASISDLLRAMPTIRSADGLDRFLTATDTGLRVLAAPQDPDQMASLGRGAYHAVHELLRRFADVIVFDCGTGLRDDITQLALHHSERTVLVCTPLLVTTKVLLNAIDHLAHGGFDLTRSTLVLNHVTRAGDIDPTRLRDAVRDRVGAVVEVPYDERAARATDLGEFQAGQLSKPMRIAVKRLAADVVTHMPLPMRIPESA